jgi:hypothetical protein
MSSDSWGCGGPSSFTSPLSLLLVLVRCRHHRPCQWHWPLIMWPWCTCHPPNEQLLVSLGWVLRRPLSLSSHCRLPPHCPHCCCCPFLPVPVPIPIVVVVVVVVVHSGSFLAWCSPMSSLASNTHDPPCEQLLAGVGPGAGLSVIVGVFCGCFLLVALVLWSELSPFLLSPLPFIVIGVPPTIHPPSSCLWGWGQVVCRSLPWVVVVGPWCSFPLSSPVLGGLGRSA